MIFNVQMNHGTKHKKAVKIIGNIADKYKTKFGMSKTNHIVIGKDQKPNENLTLKGQPIEKAEHYKHLGIIHNQDGRMKKTHRQY